MKNIKWVIQELGGQNKHAPLYSNIYWKCSELVYQQGVELTIK